MKQLSFFDTNILLYSISLNPEEATKRACSINLLSQDSGALSVQVLQEFYVQSTRSTRPNKLRHEDAVDLITAWTRFSVQETTLAIVTQALDIKAAHGFSYWDSAIIAAAVALGCGQLFSEDMQHGRIFSGVQIVNPYR